MYLSEMSFSRSPIRTGLDDLKDGTIIYASEILKDEFYFATLVDSQKIKSTTHTHYFTIDDDFEYMSFNSDFGPLNLAVLYRYCRKINAKLELLTQTKKRIIQYTSSDPKTRANAAYLVGAYSIIYLNKTPDEAMKSLEGATGPPFLAFRDASIFPATCPSPFTITLLDVFNGLKKALDNKFFNFDDFDVAEYEFYEKSTNADLSWIVPEKFIAFCGPHRESKVVQGYPRHGPEAYFKYFRRNKVTTVVRLNAEIYNQSQFTEAGFEHKNLIFNDGSAPSDSIMLKFLEISEGASGALAVHCKAGLGRTGSLIGCFIMKHYRFTANEAIAWMRLCRPGSVIGPQQRWLQCKQEMLWKLGDEFRSQVQDNSNLYKFPIYSAHRKKPYFANSNTRTSADTNNYPSAFDVVHTLKFNDGVDLLKQLSSFEFTNEAENESDDEFEEDEITQGDLLNRIKALRHISIHQPSPRASSLTGNTLESELQNGEQDKLNLKRTADSSGSSIASKSTRVDQARESTRDRDRDLDSGNEKINELMSIDRSNASHNVLQLEEY